MTRSFPPGFSPQDSIAVEERVGCAARLGTDAGLIEFPHLRASAAVHVTFELHVIMGKGYGSSLNTTPRSCGWLLGPSGGA
jgi:hypothetical protein